MSAIKVLLHHTIAEARSGCSSRALICWDWRLDSLPILALRRERRPYQLCINTRIPSSSNRTVLSSTASFQSGVSYIVTSSLQNAFAMPCAIKHICPSFVMPSSRTFHLSNQFSISLATYYNQNSPSPASH